MFDNLYVGKWEKVTSCIKVEWLGGCVGEGYLRSFTHS